MLIVPKQASAWRMDLDSFGRWLRSRWPEIRDSNKHGAHLWSWADGYETWVPADEESVWIDADWPRICAIAARLGSGSLEDLILCDEGYNEVFELRGRSEEELLALDS
jgi:hypothetical protein